MPSRLRSPACLLALALLAGIRPAGAQVTGLGDQAVGLPLSAHDPPDTEGPTPGPEPPPDWKIEWRDGFRLTGPDGKLSLRFGGRIQSDWAFYSADRPLEAAVGGFGDGTEFRRARLFFEGDLYDRVEFKAQYDFAGGDPEFKDVYVGLINLPAVGGLRIGHYKEPVSLEELTSSKYITFLERSLPVEAFAPSRNTGIMLHDGRQRYTWAVGAFRDADDFGDSVDNDELNLSARVTGLPWYEDGGRRLLHVGLSVSDREPLGDTVRFRSRPESHLSPRVVDTGGLGADRVTLLGVEAALVHGRFSAQGELLQAAVDSPGGPDPDFDGYYVYASYFFTGDHRRYKTATGAFDRTRPGRDLSSGGGAWEIALRYSTLDLDDRGFFGGEVDDVTVAVNWYLYSNVRAMLNYVLAHRDGTGEVDAVQARFQIDF